MNAPSFVDTNILVYAFSESDDTRHPTAQALMEELLDAQQATVSVQVLKEFYSVATRKLAHPLSHQAASAVIKDLSVACRVAEETVPQLERALELMSSIPLSIWDASIIAAAELAGCAQVYTEDMSHGSRIGDVHILNPFKPK
jgi:predicted nucleic acid-binding protein